MRTKLVFAFLAFGVAVAVVAGAALLVFSGGDKKQPAPADGKYANSRMRYLFDYPTDWTDLPQITFVVPKETQVLDKVTVGPAPTDEGIFNFTQVIVVQVNHQVKADGLQDELLGLDGLFKQQAATVKGTLHDPTWVELGGLRARQYVTEFVYGNTALLFQAVSAQVVTFFGDRQYIVNCQGRFDAFDTVVLPGCEQISRASASSSPSRGSGQPFDGAHDERAA